jgi:hypothetical protein
MTHAAENTAVYACQSEVCVLAVELYVERLSIAIALMD